MNNLDFTGERLVPGIEGDLVNEHLHRYAIAFNYVRGKRVLDIACGEGYGSNLMSNVAQFVAGVDVEEKIVEHARKKYSKKNLEFKHGRAEEIPYPDNFFDVVVSFETIEHLTSHDEMIKEVYRVLSNEGVLIISSPDKAVYSDSRNYKNEFHEKELYAKEFVELVEEFFPQVTVFGQISQNSSIIFPIDGNCTVIKNWSGDFHEIISDELFKAKFIIILAAKCKFNFNQEVSFFTNEIKLTKNIVSSSFVTYKKSMRYKVANLLFFPWDLFKFIRSKF